MVKPRGFTLIELLVALAIIGVLLSLVVPRFFGSVSRAEEAALRQNLFVMREAIDRYYADSGRYPGSLDDLVAKRYIRSLPVDPITGSVDTWVVILSDNNEKSGVIDVHSGASGVGRDGKPFAQW